MTNVYNGSNQINLVSIFFCLHTHFLPFPCPIEENSNYESNTRLELPGSPICQFESYTYKSPAGPRNRDNVSKKSVITPNFPSLDSLAVHSHVNNFTEGTFFGSEP